MDWRLGDAIFWIIKSLLIPLALFFLIFILPGVANSAANNSGSDHDAIYSSLSAERRYNLQSAILGETLYSSFVKASVVRVSNSIESISGDSMLHNQNLDARNQNFIVIEYIVENLTARTIGSFRAPTIFITLDNGLAVHTDSMASEILRIENSNYRPRNFDIEPLEKYRDFLVFPVPPNAGVNCIVVELDNSRYCVDHTL